MLDLWHRMIGSLPFDWAQFAFMRHALLGLLIAAPAFALLGSVVVSHRLSLFSDAIGHSALLGVGVAALAGAVDPTWPMALVAAALALGMTWLQAKTRTPSDTAIGVFLAFVTSLGLVLLSRGGANFSRYQALLIGDILSIAPGDLGLLALVALAVLLFGGLGYNALLLAGLNPSLARSRGVPALAVRMAFAAALALIVTLSLRWVGLLVINSLLVLPAAAARNLARSTAAYAGLALAFSLLCGAAGLVVSFYAATATGATIALCAVSVYAATALVKIALRRA
jgi:zinc transport system permease protein